MITAPHRRLPWVEDIYNSHDNSPLSAAAVCSEHFIIHMITAPHRRLPCVEDIFLIHKARRRWDLMPLHGKRAKASHLTPLRGKRAKVRSHMTPLRWKAREGKESPDAPALEGEESPDALKGTAFQILPDYYASCLRPYTWCSTRSYSIVSL